MPPFSKTSLSVVGTYQLHSALFWPNPLYCLDCLHYFIRVDGLKLSWSWARL